MTRRRIEFRRANTPEAIKSVYADEIRRGLSRVPENVRRMLPGNVEDETADNMYRRDISPVEGKTVIAEDHNPVVCVHTSDRDINIERHVKPVLHPSVSPKNIPLDRIDENADLIIGVEYDDEVVECTPMRDLLQTP